MGILVSMRRCISVTRESITYVAPGENSLVPRSTIAPHLLVWPWALCAVHPNASCNRNHTFLVIAPLHSTREYDPGVSTILSKEARSPVIFEVDYNACRQVVYPIFTGGVDDITDDTHGSIEDAYPLVDVDRACHDGTNTTPKVLRNGGAV